MLLFQAHTELLKDPTGAYTQLVQLQDITGDSDASNVNYQKSVLNIQSDKSISRSKRCSESLVKSMSRGPSFGGTSLHLITTSSMLVLEGTQTERRSNIPDDVEERSKVSLARLIYLNKPEIPVLLLGIGATVVSGVLFPMLGVLISSSIKSFYEPPHQLKKDSRFWTLMYVASGVVSLISLPVEYFLFGVAGGKLVERIRSLSFERIIHQEISWFDNPSNARSASYILWFCIRLLYPYHCIMFPRIYYDICATFSLCYIFFYFFMPSGTIGARLSVDASNIRRLVGDSLALLAGSTVTVLAGFIIAMVANWRLALVAAVVLPLGVSRDFFK